MHAVKILITAFLIAVSLPLSALGYQVSIEASASKREVAKNEGFTYTLSVIEEGDADKAARFEPPDFTGFRVSGRLSSSTMKVIQGKARRVTDQEYRISTDEPGEHVIPPAKLLLTDPATGEVQEILSNEVQVTVSEEERGVIKGLQEDIRDIKEPRSMADRVRLFFFGLMGIVALVLILLVGLAVFMVKRKKRTAAPEPSAPAITPLSARQEALGALREAGRLRHDAKALYSAVSEAVRVYLKAAKGMATMEATTAEIMAESEKAHLSAAAQDKLKSVLDEADLVKFAKYRPGEADMERFIERAKELVQEI